MGATEDADLAPPGAAQRHGASVCAELLNLNISLKGPAHPADEGYVGADTTAAQMAVEELVVHYQAKARAVGRLGVAIGALMGVLVGSVPLSPLRFAWPIPSGYGFATILGGLVVGVLIGYVIGDARAQLYQRMAEQARLQLQLEQRLSENDARMAQLLTALTARAAASAQRTAQAPHPAPAQPQPAPVQQVAPPPPPLPVQIQQPAVSQPVPAPPVPAPTPAPAEPLRPAAFAPPPQPVQTVQPQQTVQPHLTQVPPVAPAPVAAPNGQAALAAPPLSPPVSR